MASLYCPVCGTENPDARQFCRKCASDLRAPVRDPLAPVVPEPAPVPVRPIVIGAGVALLLVALVIGAIAFLGGAPAASPSPSPAPTEAPASATADPATEEPTAPPVTAAPTTAPTAVPQPTAVPAPIIRSFEGPASVDCNDPSFNGTIHLEWRVGNADGATLSIDGPGLYKSYVGVLGKDDVPFGCGGEPHSYTLTTTGGNGRAATQTLVISPAG